MLPLHEAIRPTTFIRSSKLNDHLGLDITLATETFQHTGSFKFRAAYNLASSVSQTEIVAASSGNFGQALAYACKLLDKKCTVVMPETSAQVKIDAVRNFGATADLIDTKKVGRKERVNQIAADKPNAYVASAYDDEYVIEGNSTLGDELAGQGFDAVITAVGGGGLVSGMIKSFWRNGERAEIWGAEPQPGNDASRSLKAGHIVANEGEPMTIADGARTVSLGDLNWEIVKDGITGIIEVPDETTIEALRHLYSLANLKSEPTGALSLGAAMLERGRFHDKKICLVVSGGNVDPAVYAKLISS